MALCDAFCCIFNLRPKGSRVQASFEPAPGSRINLRRLGPPSQAGFDQKTEPAKLSRRTDSSLGEEVIRFAASALSKLLDFIRFPKQLWVKRRAFTTH